MTFFKQQHHENQEEGRRGGKRGFTSTPVGTVKARSPSCDSYVLLDPLLLDLQATSMVCGDPGDKGGGEGKEKRKKTTVGGELG